MRLETVRIETETRVRREYEERRDSGLKHFVKQHKNIILICLAVGAVIILIVLAVRL